MASKKKSKAKKNTTKTRLALATHERLKHIVAPSAPRPMLGKRPRRAPQDDADSDSGGHYRAHRVQQPDDLTANRSHKPLKSVLEQVLVRKKKVTYQPFFSIVPPPGFQYLCVGYRRVKEFCVSECLRREALYYVVLESEYKKCFRGKPLSIFNKEQYAPMTARRGWHFPSEILVEAIETLGLQTQEALNREMNGLADTDMDSKMTVDMRADDPSVKDLYLELFPLMPADTMARSIKHAFTKGAGRVGEARLPPRRRVQLAVMATARHEHTDYDRQLQQQGVGWSNARANISMQCFALLLKWQGEDSAFELEDRFEEIVVVNSDEDSDQSDLEPGELPHVVRHKTPPNQFDPLLGNATSILGSNLPTLDPIFTGESGPSFPSVVPSIEKEATEPEMPLLLYNRYGEAFRWEEGGNYIRSPWDDSALLRSRVSGPSTGSRPGASGVVTDVPQRTMPRTVVDLTVDEVIDLTNSP